jgi:hypothetical protein
MCFELGDRGDGMLSDEYLETARTLHCVALEVTDRTLANQVRAVVEDCERRAQQAAQAGAVKASARKGLNSSSPESRSSARLQAARAVRLAERTLEKIEDPQPRRKGALSASAD